MKKLFDKTGAAYELDHEIDGTAYVRPMVKIILQTTTYSGDDFHEEEDYEPADYLVSMDRASLFDTLPIKEINQEISDKKTELAALKNEAAKELKEIKAERSAVKSDLAHAERKLDQWMKSHKVMMDLGKLLDGQALYPLTVSKNHYHNSRNIPTIPDMDNMQLKYLSVSSGSFKTGKPWVMEKYSHDSYGDAFQFFDTEEERDAVVLSEFEEACKAFRLIPRFETTSYTASTTLHYGTLLQWVKTHPSLEIPDDIQTMKAEADAKATEAKKASLQAELESL